MKKKTPPFKPGHYDAFTVLEALQQAVKDGWLCLREGRLVAAEADGAVTAAVDDSAAAPTPRTPISARGGGASGGGAAERSRGCGGGGGRGGRW